MRYKKKSLHPIRGRNDERYTDKKECVIDQRDSTFSFPIPRAFQLEYSVVSFVLSSGVQGDVREMERCTGVCAQFERQK
jgi:hypothetical protein